VVTEDGWSAFLKFVEEAERERCPAEEEGYRCEFYTGHEGWHVGHLPDCGEWKDDTAMVWRGEGEDRP
jgi:hypothetical protein